MASAVINGVVVTGSVDEIYILIQKATTKIAVSGGTSVLDVPADAEKGYPYYEEVRKGF